MVIGAIRARYGRFGARTPGEEHGEQQGASAPYTIELRTGYALRLVVGAMATRVEADWYWLVMKSLFI
jgi:hypothetical protein